jgi:hypothetical protein
MKKNVNVVSDRGVKFETIVAEKPKEHLLTHGEYHLQVPTIVEPLPNYKHLKDGDAVT